MATEIEGTALEQLIRPAVSMAVTEAVASAVKGAQDEVERRLKAEVGRLVLQVLSYYEVSRSGNVLIIKVELPERKT